MVCVHISLPSVEDQKKAEYVFPVDILEQTAVKSEDKIFTANKAMFQSTAPNGICQSKGDRCNLILRPLERRDYDRGYLELLKQLTVIGEISPERFDERFLLMKKPPQAPASYYVCVLEDQDNGQVIGSVTLQVEFKMIRNCGIRGRVEDVVVDKAYRGKYLALILVNLLVELAKDVNCYKISLECKDHLVNFYCKCGFEKEPLQNYMSQRFIK